MKITHLGQAGLLLETGSLTVIIDPYLSDSVGAIDPKKHRRVPVDQSFFDIRPDVLVFTHDHLDHHDPETAERILKTHPGVTVLAPTSVWQKVRQHGGDHNYVLLDSFSRWTEGGVRFSAVPAAHSDPHAIGVVVEAEGKTLYITGDTVYNTRVLAALPETIDVVFLPVNGAGNNMNAADAARFVRDCGAKLAVPVHVGLFDELTGDILNVENKKVLATYESMEV